MWKNNRKKTRNAISIGTKKLMCLHQKYKNREQEQYNEIKSWKWKKRQPIGQRNTSMTFGNSFTHLQFSLCWFVWQFPAVNWLPISFFFLSRFFGSNWTGERSILITSRLVRASIVNGLIGFLLCAPGIDKLEISTRCRPIFGDSPHFGRTQNGHHHHIVARG